MLKMKFLFTPAWMFLILACLSAGPAQCDTIFTNIGSSFNFFTASDTIGTLAGDDYKWAVAFTPTNDFVFDSASFALGLASGENTLDVTLATDFIPHGLNTNQVGTVLENIQAEGILTVESGNVVGGIATVTSALYPTLNAGSQYWLILSLPDPQALGVWYLNETGNGNPFAISRTSIAPYFGIFPPGSELTPAFSVSGTIVPEPKLPLVTGFGVVILFALSKQKKRIFRQAAAKNF